MECKTPTKRKVGRPRGRQYDAIVQLRLPRPVVRILRVLAHREKKTLNDLIRGAVSYRLGEAVNAMAERANNPDLPDNSRLVAIEIMHMLARAGLYLSPVGLEIARSKALEEDRKNAGES